MIVDRNPVQTGHSALNNVTPYKQQHTHQS